MHGPEVGELLALYAKDDGDVAADAGFVQLPARMELLRLWLRR